MLYLRVFSALAGVPLVVFLVFQGGWYLFTAVFLVALIGQFEFYNLLAQKGFTGHRMAGYFGTAGVMWSFYQNRLDLLPHLFSLLIIILLLLQMFRWEKTYNIINDIAGTLLGVLYPGLLFAYIFSLRHQGITPLLMVFVITWCNDTGAYFIGRAFGKRPLFPSVSPKKTIEGAAGGMLASIFAAALFTRRFEIPAWQLAGLGFFLGCAAQIGDLAESMLKRYAGVKDSGRLIPGHGGVLDRFDSILFAIPLAYLVLSLLG